MPESGLGRSTVSTLLLLDDERMACVLAYELGTTSYLVYDAVDVGSELEPDDTSGGRASPVTYTAVAASCCCCREPLEPFDPLPFVVDADVLYVVCNRGLQPPYGSYGLPYCNNTIMYLSK